MNFQPIAHAEVNDSPHYKTAKCFEKDFSGITRFPAVVERSVDGDTIKISYKRKLYNIRFLSIDTPETHFMGKSQGYWADQAAAQLESFLPVGSKVEIQIEKDNTCDHYGRLLGYVYKDGVNINEAMIQKCLATMYCIYPSVAQCNKLGELTTQCISEKKGIYSDPSFKLPYEWRRVESKRPHEKWVGNIDSGDVFAPGSLDQVPIGKRVFFMSESDIQAPFHKSSTH